MEYLLMILFQIRNIMARRMADANPEGYDGTDPRAGVVDSATDAYTGVGSDGFRMFGAFGNASEDLPDWSTMGLEQILATDGELPGMRTETRESHDDDGPDGLSYDARNWNAYQSSAEGLTDTTTTSDDNCESDAAERAYIRSEYRNFVDSLNEARREAYMFGNSKEIERLNEVAQDARESRDEQLETALVLGRWAHVRDAHLEEQAIIERMLSLPVGAPGPMPGEMEASKLERERRVERIRHTLESMRRAYSLARKRADRERMDRIEREAKSLKSDLRKQYGRMASQLGRGSDPYRWRFLPFTREQGEKLGILYPRQ
jgi:hypothetical protein